jgi:hypothetical protein
MSCAQLLSISPTSAMPLSASVHTLLAQLSTLSFAFSAYPCLPKERKVKLSIVSRNVKAVRRGKNNT